MSDVLQIVGYGWLSVFIFMSILWYIGKEIQNYAIVDVGWNVSVVLICEV